MQEILKNIANEVAQRCGFIQRIRKFSGAVFIQTLVFGWLENPDASYADLVNTARALGINGSRQAIEQRMTPEAAETLKETLQAAATQVLIPFLKYNVPFLTEILSEGIPIPDKSR